MVKIAILGYGTVGSGTAEVLAKNRQTIEKKAGDAIEIAYVLDRRDLSGEVGDRWVSDYDKILSDPEVSVLVEAMGGIEPAYSFIKAGLLAGKSAVTSNKELVAAKGAELLKIAREQNVNFLFEASVGGGIPIIHPLYQCLGANQISEIAGILNGTTNFILTKMFKEHMSFADALKIAMDLGYAEQDPTADVEGHDACRKICILGSIAFGSHVYPERVHTEGITALTAEDVAYAAAYDSTIKLIGRAKLGEDGKVQVMVSPALIGCDSQLSGIDDVYNGILVRGDATGDVVFYGKGAGKLPTASAVVSDVIDCVKAPGTLTALHWEDSDGTNVADTASYPVTAYLRVAGDDDAKQAILAEVGATTELSRPNQPAGEFALVTGQLTEAKLAALKDKIAGMGATLLGCIRVLDY